MDINTKVELIKFAGRGISALIEVAHNRPRAKPGEPLSEETTKVTKTVSSSGPLPTAEETTIELKRRLAKELYRAELDLAAGLQIAGKPCACLDSKHTLMLEAAAEELISQDPGNPVYKEIIEWIPANRPKLTPEAIRSGQYVAEYPYMANEFKNFRKRVMGSAGADEINPAGKITLELAKKMAAEEAAKEVERQWQTQEKRE